MFDGTEPMLGVGLFITGRAFWSGARAKDASVPMLEALMLLAGDAGRAEGVKGEGLGFAGAAVLLDKGSCRGTDGTAGASIGAETAFAVVGVACGVDTAELALAIEMGVGVCFAPALSALSLAAAEAG